MAAKAVKISQKAAVQKGRLGVWHVTPTLNETMFDDKETISKTNALFNEIKRHQFTMNRSYMAAFIAGFRNADCDTPQARLVLHTFYEEFKTVNTHTLQSKNS